MIVYRDAKQHRIGARSTVGAQHYIKRRFSVTFEWLISSPCRSNTVIPLAHPHHTFTLLAIERLTHFKTGQEAWPVSKLVNRFWNGSKVTNRAVTYTWSQGGEWGVILVIRIVLYNVLPTLSIITHSMESLSLWSYHQSYNIIDPLSQLTFRFMVTLLGHACREWRLYTRACASTNLGR